MKKIQLIFAMLIISAVLLSACQPAATPTAVAEQQEPTKEQAPKLKVAMVLPGLKTDEAFNQYTYEGMMRAAKDFNLETAYVEEVAQDEQVEVIRQFAQEGYDIIIGQGGQFGEALMTVAKEFPDQNFIFSVATDTGGVPNLTAATVSYSHAGYIAGVMACHTTNNNKVAMILGEWYDPHRQMEASIKKALTTCGKEIEFTSVATGSWSDVNKAREASLALVADGYDVLIPCLDAAYVGVLTAAQDSENVKVVGTVIDMAPVAPEVVVGSALFNWNELGYQEASGNLLDGKTHILGMAENGISYVTNDLLSAEGKAAVEEAVAGLKSGELGIAP
ncbi:MAG: BMP family ABC transporter substrate-binding protein [Chloroflexi bacterium]|nr:BMP family ABC transporter substrate-binding protein [Chloroflexota bacterium]